MMNYHWKTFYCFIESTIKLCHWYKPGGRSCDGVVMRVHLNAWPLRQVGHWLRKRLFIIQDCENVSMRKKGFPTLNSLSFCQKITWFRYCRAGFGGGPGWIVLRLGALLLVSHFQWWIFGIPKRKILLLLVTLLLVGHFQWWILGIPLNTCHTPMKCRELRGLVGD